MLSLSPSHSLALYFYYFIPDLINKSPLLRQYVWVHLHLRAIQHFFLLHSLRSRYNFIFCIYIANKNCALLDEYMAIKCCVQCAIDHEVQVNVGSPMLKWECDVNINKHGIIKSICCIQYFGAFLIAFNSKVLRISFKWII